MALNYLPFNVGKHIIIIAYFQFYSISSKNTVLKKLPISQAKN
jgi:hypothetical protein